MIILIVVLSPLILFTNKLSVEPNHRNSVFSNVTIYINKKISVSKYREMGRIRTHKFFIFVLLTVSNNLHINQCTVVRTANLAGTIYLGCSNFSILHSINAPRPIFHDKFGFQHYYMKKYALGWYRGSNNLLN